MLIGCLGMLKVEGCPLQQPCSNLTSAGEIVLFAKIDAFLSKRFFNILI